MNFRCYENYFGEHPMEVLGDLFTELNALEIRHANSRNRHPADNMKRYRKQHGVTDSLDRPSIEVSAAELKAARPKHAHAALARLQEWLKEKKADPAIAAEDTGRIAILLLHTPKANAKKEVQADQVRPLLQRLVDDVEGQPGENDAFVEEVLALVRKPPRRRQR